MSLYEIHDLSQYKIEKNVPVPERDSNTARIRQLVEDMDYGDSVVLPIELLYVTKNVTSASEERFTIRDIKNKHGAVENFRLWKQATLSDGN